MDDSAVLGCLPRCVSRKQLALTPSSGSTLLLEHYHGTAATGVLKSSAGDHWVWLDESGCQYEVGHVDSIALTRGVPPSRTEPQPTTPPLELVFTLCWRCTKASLLALVTEMRNLANKEERNTKVNQLGRLAFEILPSILSDGYVDSRDIEALRNQKGVGEWSVEQLQQLRDTGACSYLMALRARRRQ